MNRTMSEQDPNRHRRYLTLVAAAALAVSLSACGNAETPKAHTDPNQPVPTTLLPGPTRLHCNKLDKEQWTAVPDNFNMQAMADALHVRLARIADGTVGPARCDEGLSARAIQAHAARTVLTVSGVSDHCLAVGTVKPPQVGVIYHELVVVCPGPANGPSIGA